MTTIATSLERCTLITMHERAPHTVPQADPQSETSASASASARPKSRRSGRSGTTVARGMTRYPRADRNHERTFWRGAGVPVTDR